MPRAKDCAVKRTDIIQPARKGSIAVGGIVKVL